MEDLKDPAKRMEMEYATQFFGFPPESLVDTMIGDATAAVQDYLEAAKRRILEDFSPHVTKEQLEESFKTIDERYQELTETIYYKFACFLKHNVFHLPRDFLLPSDKVHASSVNADGADMKLAEERFNKKCDAIKVAKVEKAVLGNRIRNLKLVKERQNLLLQRAKNLKQSRRVSHLIHEEADKMAKKLDILSEKMRQIEGQKDAEDSAQKRKLEVEDVSLAKMLKCSTDP